MSIITVLTFHRHSPIIELHLSLCFRVEGNVLKDKEELFPVRTVFRRFCGTVYDFQKKKSVMIRSQQNSILF